MNPTETVRRGYDEIADAYLANRLRDTPDVAMLEELEARLDRGARVLDLGCGAGDPITKRLAEKYRVTGLDFSCSQLELARDNVPDAEFRLDDIVTANLGRDIFDGVCSYYAIIHIPRRHHLSILQRVYLALKPGGVALLCLGAQSIEEDYDDDYLGTRMFWSHFDADAYLAMMREIGYEIELSRIVADASCESSAGHLFVVARRANHNPLKS